jgi:hypothetical protein
MHLTDHLTECSSTNSDHELVDRAHADLHLSSCDECTARLSALQALFNEVDLCLK